MEESVKKSTTELFETLIQIKSVGDFEKLFEDLCTYNEIEQMGERLVAAKMLLEGKTYAQITSQCNISTATLSRVSRCVQRGSGGYNKVLKSLIEKENSTGTK